MEFSVSEIKQKIKLIDALEADVRKHINITRYQNNLIKDGNNWNQICCSLDTIGDTAYAINDYVDSEYPKKVGLKYVSTYGLLQALFIQQDAISHLSEAFSVAYQHSETLKKIRLLRNAAIGHPTKQDHTKDAYTYYNYISRITLSKEGFTLMRCYDERKTDFVEVELFPIMLDQLNEIKSAYEVIANTLKEADRMHREKYKHELLADVFPSGMDYGFQKVAQGIHSPSSSNAAFGLSMLQMIQEAYKKFEEDLIARGDLNEYTKYDLNGYNHALSKLEVYLRGDAPNIAEIDARIYHFYVTEKHADFVKIAEEIDDAYKLEGKKSGSEGEIHPFPHACFPVCRPPQGRIA